MLATFVAFAPRGHPACLPDRNAGHLAFLELAGVRDDFADRYIRAVEAER